MRNRLFPTLVVDGFLDYPDELVDYAKTLDYQCAENHNWPGKRTNSLHLLSNDLFMYIGNKILKCYGFSNFTYKATAFFQLVDKNYHKGWVHSDDDVLTSIIYLNKKNNLNSGTSLYKPKKFYTTTINITDKHNFFKKMSENDDYIMTKEVKEKLEENNDLFEETLNVKNLYNRMISFESGIFHSANDFSIEEPRLTLIYFFNEIRCENGNYSFLK